MPHADLKYSSDLEFDAPEVLRAIEATINAHDSGAGVCKGRAYPAAVFHHTHLLVEVSLLTKPHRDAAFTRALRDDLEKAVKAHLRQRCYFSMAIHYSDDTYLTNVFEPSAG